MLATCELEWKSCTEIVNNLQTKLQKQKLYRRYQHTTNNSLDKVTSKN